MELRLKIAALLFAGLCVVSCGTTKTTVKMNKSTAKKTEVIDHKNQKWGKTPPEWVSMERSEIEEMEHYKDSYIFKFESEKAKDLEGSQLWLKNFSAPSELARMVTQRIKDVGAAAAVGNPEAVERYLEEVSRTVSATELHGFKKEDDYWVQQRYFTADGEVEGDFYTVQLLYSIPRKTLDKLIKDALNGTTKPKTEEEIRARDLVRKALREDL